LGALQLQQESSPLANSAIAYAYDELGRLASRTVQGAGPETFAYDAIGRQITHGSDLGAFTLSYLGQTGQLTGRALTGSTLATTWSYLPNSGDRRLAGIDNTGLASGQYSNYAYTTTPENFISAITETSDASAVYPAAGTQTATYNNLNQLTNLSGQALTYDANGNLTSDGQRTYSWDAENRLVGITYPGVSGKATAFTYDGLGRRTAITSTPAGGGSATATGYLWCRDSICQARDSSNTPIRSYYDEGEYLPGTPAQALYYGIDQIGSVRRVFTSASAYSYDPYGSPIQVTAPLTDFVYSGLFYNADSRLYLANYRAYDPAAGRWLSRDPLGEGSDLSANLYSYAYGNPLSYSDGTGLQPGSNPNGVVPGGPWEWSPNPQNPRGGRWQGPPPPGGGSRPSCTYADVSPINADPYWKKDTPPSKGSPPGTKGTKEWYDTKGNPITPDQAHPGPPLPANPIAPLIRFGSPIGVFFGVMLYSAPLY
jgi:RHS repeat-associated protein